MNGKSNVRSRLRTSFCFLVVLSGLTFVVGALAQPTATFQQQSNAPALQIPASNSVVLATTAGKVRELDSKGLLLESNLVFLPRIKISDLSDAELHSLLETKKGYVALTSLGPLSERTAQSVAIEHQLERVWHDGKSLTEKIQTRLELLDEMRAYNADVANLPAIETGANNATARANLANDRMSFKDQAATNAANGVDNAEYAHAVGEASHQQVHDARSEYEAANESAARADNRAIVANDRAAAANQSVQNYLDACAAISQNLANYGINVPASPPFNVIPPLSVRAEVDAERVAGMASTNGK